MRSEQSIQTAIKNKLERDGWTVVKLISTSMAGIPDLMALKDGKARFIEVKSESGKLSVLQQHRINQLRAMGFDAIVARSINDL